MKRLYKICDTDGEPHYFSDRMRAKEYRDTKQPRPTLRRGPDHWLGETFDD